MYKIRERESNGIVLHKQLGDRMVPLRRLYSFNSARIGILSSFSGFRPFLASKSRSNLTIFDFSSDI